MSAKNIVVDVAKKFANRNGDETVVLLADGRPARVIPVPASLVDDISSQFVSPTPPKFLNEDKGREEENPFDPTYLRERAEVEKKRGSAMLDVMVLVGVELIEGVPPVTEWLPKLKYLEKRGLLNLSNFDLDDPMEREFVYKRYIGVDATVIEQVTRHSGVMPEAVREAQESFPGS